MKMEEEIVQVGNQFAVRRTLTLSKKAYEATRRGYEFAAVVRMANGRFPPRKVFIDTLERLWNPGKDTGYIYISDDKMIVNFGDSETYSRVLEGGPWMVEGWLLLVDKWERDSLPNEIHIYKFNAWVRLYNVPLKLMRGRLLEEMAGMIGEVVYVPEPPEESKLRGAKVWYARVKVRMDIRNPFIHGFNVNGVEGGPFWVVVRYEILPNICFKCWLCTHSTASCTQSTS